VPGERAAAAALVLRFEGDFDDREGVEWAGTGGGGTGDDDAE
jgi:hypothetical protein